MSVTLITATGGRQEAFDLCREYVRRQTFSGKLQWIVVDDCKEKTAYNERLLVRPNMSVDVVRPVPFWFQTNTLARNLLTAIPFVKYRKVLFIEDDDWYHPDYVKNMAEALDGHEIVGSLQAFYYHVREKRMRVFHQDSRSSLSQTGISDELLANLCAVCNEQPDWIDIRLWESALEKRYFLDDTFVGVVGMKGMPGRKGIGIGHVPGVTDDWISDPLYVLLNSLIGVDTKNYERFGV